MINNHTSSLFHYTDKLDNLISILKEGFRVSYCAEQITDTIFIAIPMVSFCDIPLECNAEHRSKYGSYAIGVNKAWMIDEYRELLSPVHYVINEEPILGAWHHHLNYLKAVEYINKYEDRKRKQGRKLAKVIIDNEHIYEGYAGFLANPNDRKTLLMLNDLFHAQGYANYSLGITKNYICKHKGKNFCAYDECEWRILIPEDRTLNGITTKWFWSKDEYMNWKSTRNNYFVDGVTLAVKHEFVDYIVIKNDCEKSTILSNFQETEGKYLSDKIIVI